MSVTLLFEPLDVVLFRDARPFVAGEGHLARSLFPPPLGTMLGIVRTALLEAMGIAPADFGKYIRDPRQAHKNKQHYNAIAQELRLGSDSTGLSLRSFSLAQQRNGLMTYLFPMPLDLVGRSLSLSSVKRYVPTKTLPVTTDRHEKGLLWTKFSSKENGLRRWITESALCCYLLGESFERVGLDPWVNDETELVEREIRPGVSLERGKQTARESFLYWIEYLRLHPKIRFAVSLQLSHHNSTLVKSLDRFASTQGLPIGGEGRLCAIVRTEWEPAYSQDAFTAALVRAIRQGRRFCLVLMTPAFWESGWRPDFLTRDGQLKLQNGTIKANLVAAAVGEPLPVGGWDLARGKPKPMRKAVPAGSVYFFELEQGNPEALILAFHDTRHGDDCHMGYGHLLVGTW